MNCAYSELILCVVLALARQAAGKRSGLLTCIAMTENVLSCTRMKS